MRPTANDYAGHFARYIDLVPEEDVLPALDGQASETQRLLSRIDETQAAFRYAPDKWSLKQVIGHITDAERVFGYRALCFARGETQPLPGFDENVYVDNARFDDWKLGDLAEQFALTRRAHVVMLRNLPAEAWERRGVASSHEITVRALAYAIVGHERHHLRVLRERYQL